MNNSNVAKNGFKTFILTLSVSLIVFSTIYYIVTSRGGSDKFEASTSQVSYAAPEVTPSIAPTTEPVADATKAAVKGASTVAAAVTPTPAPTASTFGQLADAKVVAKPQIAKGTVLAGATVNTKQTTQSTSPNTGVVEITAGLFISLALFLVGFYVVFLNPRKMALMDFEKSVIKKL